jgi:hypothetical protein
MILCGRLYDLQARVQEESYSDGISSGVPGGYKLLSRRGPPYVNATHSVVKKSESTQVLAGTDSADE